MSVRKPLSAVLAISVMVAVVLLGVEVARVSLAPTTAAVPERATPPSLVPGPTHPDLMLLQTAEPLRSVNKPPSVISNPAESSIIADLESPGRDFHQAALQRAREMDDRSIIPLLRGIAHRITDDDEKADILETIDFLNLPSIAEEMTEAKAARTAAGLPDPPQSITNRWTGRPFIRKE